MTNKTAFKILWKWVVEEFRRKFLRYKNINAFFKKGKVEAGSDEQLWTMRKSFNIINNKKREMTEYTLKIEFLISKTHHIPMDDEEIDKLEKPEPKKSITRIILDSFGSFFK